MKQLRCTTPALRCLALVLLLPLAASATTRYVDLNSPSSTWPYTNWSTAATNIQEAIDAADPDDQIFVTNGVYATGGRVIAGDLTNRVALDKPVTVQSVNGPWFTTIRGNGAVNGTSAVRCAWVTNGAVLSGFTLTAGATRTGGDNTNQQSGGGVLCVSSSAFVRNCLIISNTANRFGGGACQGTIVNSALLGNQRLSGSAAAYATLVNCTAVSNWSSGAFYWCRATNCIDYFNNNGSGPDPATTYSYSCAKPLPSGAGNFIDAPQLLGDSVHLTSTSPCRGRGTNIISGDDIDDQVWSDPPSVGCDEWHAEPAIIGTPGFSFGGDPSSFAINVFAVGEEPFTCFWTRTGVQVTNDATFSSSETPNLFVRGIHPADAGLFQVVVSNAFGTATSVVAQLTIRYVDAANSSPQPPYLSWVTAATNIQDAIDAAMPGEIVIVTNGTYASGGKVMSGNLTNRIAIDRPIRVQSVNGPWVTLIRGAGATNGNSAVRCAWLTNGASLVGFTISDGATRSLGSGENYTGGGVSCASTNAFVSNCYVRTNASDSYGGGIYRGTLNNCLVLGNATSVLGYGAVYGANLMNCTVVSNLVTGVVNSALTNCIVYTNRSGNYFGSTLSYCCATPLPAGTGNFTNAPLFFADTIRLDSASPCIGAGTNMAVGTDIFGQPWENPPSVGCAERQKSPLLATQPKVQLTSSPVGFRISFVVAGEPPLICYWTREGEPVEEDGHFSSSHTPNLVASGIQYSDAGDYQVVASNAFGMVTSAVAAVVIHCVDAAGTNPVSPYLTWETAATNIQDAIDAAVAGEIVLVTNGVYATGGKVDSFGQTNRVWLGKPITVLGLNGYGSTVIQGAWDKSGNNGPAAVRCAFLTDGALLTGFTLRNGATLTTTSGQYGGGVYGTSTNAIAANCLFTNNNAHGGGGAVAYGTVMNSLITMNQAGFHGGGTYFAPVRNCTIVENSSRSLSVGGAYRGSVRNSIVYWNHNVDVTQASNYERPGTTDIAYSCTYPSVSGSGNTTVAPQFLDVFYHLLATSPLRGAGNALYSAGVDADGESWAAPPAIGWDEVVDANLVGPLSVSIIPAEPFVLVNRMTAYWGLINGKVAYCDWSFSDGIAITNTASSVIHTWTNSGDQVVTFTAYNHDHPEGVSTNLVVHIAPLAQPNLQAPRINNNAFQFGFEAQRSARYTIQYATNLVPPVTWQNLQTIFYSPGGPTQITDSAWTNAVRFYRVLVQ